MSRREREPLPEAFRAALRAAREPVISSVEMEPKTLWPDLEPSRAQGIQCGRCRAPFINHKCTGCGAESDGIV